jgi:hypothetical protein
MIFRTAEQRADWRALIATLESMLRLHKHEPGTLVGLADYLYQRTGGMIGSLSQLIRGAAIPAVGGDEQITRDLLDLVPVDYAAARATPQRRTRAHVVPGARTPQHQRDDKPRSHRVGSTAASAIVLLGHRHRTRELATTIRTTTTDRQSTTTATRTGT